MRIVVNSCMLQNVQVNEEWCTFINEISFRDSWLSVWIRNGQLLGAADRCSSQNIVTQTKWVQLQDQ